MKKIPIFLPTILKIIPLGSALDSSTIYYQLLEVFYHNKTLTFRVICFNGQDRFEFCAPDWYIYMSCGDVKVAAYIRNRSPTILDNSCKEWFFVNDATSVFTFISTPLLSEQKKMTFDPHRQHIPSTVIYRTKIAEPFHVLPVSIELIDSESSERIQYLTISPFELCDDDIYEPTSSQVISSKEKAAAVMYAQAKCLVQSAYEIHPTLFQNQESTMTKKRRVVESELMSVLLTDVKEEIDSMKQMEMFSLENVWP